MSQHPQPGQPYGQGPVPWQPTQPGGPVPSAPLPSAPQPYASPGDPWGAQSGPAQSPVVNPWSPQPQQTAVQPVPPAPTPVPSAPYPPAPTAVMSAVAAPTPPAPERPSRLGSIALVLGLVAALLVPLSSGWYGSAIAGSTDYLPALEARIGEALRTRMIVPVLGTGSVLGLLALALGVAATVTRRGRGRGIAAAVVAVLLPGLSFLGYLVGMLGTGVR